MHQLFALELDKVRIKKKQSNHLIKIIKINLKLNLIYHSKTQMSKILEPLVRKSWYDEQIIVFCRILPLRFLSLRCYSISFSLTIVGGICFMDILARFLQSESLFWCIIRCHIMPSKLDKYNYIKILNHIITFFFKKKIILQLL